MPTDKKISELPIASAINASDISLLINNGTDYQYTFTSVLQFLTANLATGANISFGTVLPQNTTGNNGDVFVNTSAGSFAQKLSGTWTVVYTLPAANGADGTLLYGTGIPGSGTGKDTDSYINTLTGIFYKRPAAHGHRYFRWLPDLRAHRVLPAQTGPMEQTEIPFYLGMAIHQTAPRVSMGISISTLLIINFLAQKRAAFGPLA